jgi:hypothetical protein
VLVAKVKPLRVVVALALLVLENCSSTNEASSDAAVGDSAKAICGNGSLDFPSNTPQVWEECDDGALNGTTDSLCTKQCTSGAVDPWTVLHASLGYPSTRNVQVYMHGQFPVGLAFTGFDDTGVHVIPAMRPEYFNGVVPPLITLKVDSRPVALGVIDPMDAGAVLPIWIESASSAPQLRMYYADVFHGAPEIHEIVYPFPDGTRPSLVVSRDRVSVMLLDQSSVAPYDLLVALILVRSPTDVVTSTLRIPSPGLVRGVAVESTENDGIANVQSVEQVVQFFDDTLTFVAIENRVPTPTDPWSLNGSYQLYESGRGRWPFHVVSGTTWFEGGFSLGVGDPKYTHPMSLATLTDTGDIYLWQFSSGLDGESFLAPFGHVAVGTRVMGMADAPWDDRAGLWALEPDGHVVVLKDADGLDLRSGALKPQRFPAGAAWIMSAGVDDSGRKGGFSADGLFLSRP